MNRSEKIREIENKNGLEITQKEMAQILKVSNKTAAAIRKRYEINLQIF